MREQEIREIGSVPPESRILHFSGEEFIEGFLNPLDVNPCGTHHDITCLCDVDVSKTAHLTWDKVPPSLAHVESVEDLVVAAANIWLNLDLARGIRFLPEWWDDEPEKLEQLLHLVRERKGKKAIAREMGTSRVADHTLAAIRRAVGASTMSNKDRPLPRARILKLHEDGKSVVQMQRIFHDEMAYPPSGSRIYAVLRENNLTPHKSMQGAPRGYKRGCGLSYREWRELHGDS